MPTKKTTATPADDLLSIGTKSETTEPPTFEDLVETPEAEAPAPDNTSVLEDDTDAEIAALKAALAKPLPDADRPTPEAELSPKERELRDLRDQMAKRRAAIAEAAAPVYEEVGFGDDVILIHILQDGFTVNGQVTYRGQEFEFPVGGKAYEQTVNRHGKSWLELTEDEQYDKWGDARFGHGPWPFKKLRSLTLRDLPEGSTEADLEAVRRAAERNDRRAPVSNA